MKGENRRMKQLKIEERYTQRTGSIYRYMIELNKLPLITVEKEIELSSRAKNGDREAINELAKANLRFVISVAKQYSSNDAVLLEELIAQGNIGLLYAAETFDHTRGFKFISYAVWRIRKEIMQYLTKKNRIVRLPTSFNLDRNRIRKAEEKLAAALDRPPNKEELIEELKRQGYKMTEDRFDFIQITGSTRIALEKPKTDDYDPAPIDWLNIGVDPSQSTEEQETKKVVRDLLKSLSPVEEDIVKKRLGIPTGDPMSLYQIGLAHNYSSERVRQIFQKAVRKISRRARKLNLQDLLQ